MADTILKKHIKKNPFVRQKLYGLVSRTVYAYRPYLCRYQQKRNGDVFAVNIKSTAGFAANLEFCLEILLYCELHGMTPYLVLTGKNYLSKERGDDWFAYFFDNLQLSEDQKQRINENKVAISKIRTIQELGLPENYDIKLNLENAPKLVRKYIGIKKHILDEVDIFCENNFTNKFVLGIHFRGTDKDECPRTSWDNAMKNVQYYLEKYPQINSIFISTDENGFIEYMRKEFTSIPVVFRDDAYRSNDMTPVHMSLHGENYEKGRDAIVNCLIMSRCNMLMKVPSALSAWAKLFNPELPVIMLNKPYEPFNWFPDREILKQSNFEIVD